MHGVSASPDGVNFRNVGLLSIIVTIVVVASGLM